MEDNRVDIHSYFMSIADMVSERATCVRRRVGAVAVKDKHILATGYNGVPTGISHCTKDTCIRQKLNIPSGQRHEICRGVHAEQNLIVQSSLHSSSLKDSTVYCTTKPCIICLKLLINCGVSTIYYTNDYKDEMVDEMVKESNIKLIELISK